MAEAQQVKPTLFSAILRPSLRFSAFLRPSLWTSLAVASLLLHTPVGAQNLPPKGKTVKPAVKTQTGMARQAKTKQGKTKTGRIPRNLEGAREFDRVVGIIGDKVVLRSEIEDQLASTDMPQEERKAQELAVLSSIARDQIWIQYGKVLAPEEVDQFIDRRLNEYQNEQIKDYGSFTKMTEELALIGTSWENLREIKRNEYLAQYAQSEAWRRHAGLTGTMLVTPKMMRDYYKSHPKEFSEQSAAEIAVIYLSPGAKAEELSRARSTWQKEDLSAVELAAKFPGSRPQKSRHITPGSDNPEFVEVFARTNAEGSVSKPISRGPVIILLKVARKIEAKQQSFDDALTQQRIRVGLTRLKMDMRQRQLLIGNQHKVFIWPQDLLLGR